MVEPRHLDPNAEGDRRDLGDQLSYVRYRETQHESWPEIRAEYRRLGARFEVLDQIVRARARLGMTQAELASAMGTTRSAISRLEAGNHAPTIDTLADAAAALGLDLKIRLVKRRPSNN